MALAQTADGFLWVGAPTGLFRFDGVRCEPFRSLSGDPLLSPNIQALFAAPTGGLWIGYTFGGFSFLSKGKVTNYAGGVSSSSGSVLRFAQDRNGVVWAATSSGLLRFDRGRWERVGAEWNAPTGKVDHLGFDREGVLWAITNNALFDLRPGSRQFSVAEKDLASAGFSGWVGFTWTPIGWWQRIPRRMPPSRPPETMTGRAPFRY